jgi:hypothetical protein
MVMTKKREVLLDTEKHDDDTPPGAEKKYVDLGVDSHSSKTPKTHIVVSKTCALLSHKMALEQFLENRQTSVIEALSTNLNNDRFRHQQE